MLEKSAVVLRNGHNVIKVFITNLRPGALDVLNSIAEHYGQHVERVSIMEAGDIAVADSIAELNGDKLPPHFFKRLKDLK